MTGPTADGAGPDSLWPPADCPPLAWPDLEGTDPQRQEARRAWCLRVVAAYAALWEGHASQAHLQPVGEDDLSALEARLGCALPGPLRDYHRHIGALSLAETLCSVGPGPTPIQPLMDAFPGIDDLAADEADLGLARKLVVFGDYLGNGNMFCFHMDSGAVYYFDHDGGELLTLFFPSVDQYVEALMVLCLAEVHDDEDAGEALLAQRFGPRLVRKWRY